MPVRAEDSWPLLLGMLLLLRRQRAAGHARSASAGAIEGYDAATMSLVMSAYYVGFLIGSRRATRDDPPGRPRAGVRGARLADLGRLHPLCRGARTPGSGWRCGFVVGFCFAGVYVVAESWLNDAATNETRGQALSLYMIVQMVGIISAQFMLNLATPRATRCSW